VEEVKRSSKEDKNRILKQFDKLCEKSVLKERREKWVKKAEAAFEEDKDEDEESLSGEASTSSGCQSSRDKPDTSSSSDEYSEEGSAQQEAQEALSGARDDETLDESYENDLKRAMQLSTEIVDEDEQAYHRDLELAKKMSMEGHSRGGS
jgi:glucan-binding YG repeat protein